MAEAAITRGDGTVPTWVEVITEVIREVTDLTLLTVSEVSEEAQDPVMTFLTEDGVCLAPRLL